MINNFGKINIRGIIIFFAILFIAVFLGKNVAETSSPRLLFLLLGIVVAVITLINLDIGLFIIILSMLLSPEITVGTLPDRDVVIRLEDLLLIVVTFSWLVKTAISKEIGIFRNNPLTLPIGIYILACVILTLRGMLLGEVVPLKGLFYILKYIEYFLLYFMVYNQIRSKRQVSMFVVALLLTCAITAFYGNLQIGAVSRVSAPFEGKGEPNTLGGYLVFMLAIIMGIFLYSTSKRVKLCLLGMVAFLILPCLLFTLSRTSYITVIPVWISLLIFGQRRWPLIAIPLVAIVLGTFFMPRIVQERIEYTFTARSSEIPPVTIGDITLDPSASGRIRSWGQSWEKIKERPILGYGITGLGFIDGQYILILGELGVVGLLAFLFLLWSIFKHIRKVSLELENRFYKGLSLGVLAGVIGMSVFNYGANAFIITRIMEPFWFTVAMVLRLPQVQEETKALS